jgi:hypothetical protein
MYCYYLVANDFGFPPASLNFIANINVISPASSDLYNPNLWNFGNSALSQTSCTTGSMIDWEYVVNANDDLRMAAVSCSMVGGTAVYSQMINFGTCNVQQISPLSNKPACFTT